MKPLVIYHANCADGFGAAFAAWLKLGDEAEYVPMKYGQPFPYTPDLRQRDLYILDFSFPRDVMDSLFANAKRGVWRDHHKTAFEMWCGEYEKGMQHDQIGDIGSCEIDIFLDDNKSGAMLAWEYFHPGTYEVPMLIRHIDDYDRWQFKLEGTKAFNKALWSYAPWSFVNWKAMFITEGDWQGQAYVGMNYKRMLTEGAAILRAHDQNVQSVVKGARRECELFTFDGVPFGTNKEANCKQHLFFGLAANCPSHLASDVGDELANQSGTFGLCWHVNKDGKCICSLRSNGDYDVSAIAKAFGGGGHRNAAGFEVPIDTLLGWMK